jgi:mRNA-degrading endonuclease RelE of RelBE toxin-antitoxin system
MLPAREVRLSTEFRQDVRALRKRYRSLLQDLQTLTDELGRGIDIGDRVQGVGYEVYKARLGNRDLQRGKSGGYRVVYLVETGGGVVLLSLYAKSDREDISAAEVRRAIGDWEAEERAISADRASAELDTKNRDPE